MDDDDSLPPAESGPVSVGESRDEIESLDVPIRSPAIRRLIEEVRAEEVNVPRSYNRTFNRHNR